MNRDSTFSSHYILLLALALSLFPLGCWGQKKASDALYGSKSFAQNHTLTYSIFFRWGIIKGKAGEAQISTRKQTSNGQWFQQLLFQTTGIFDKIFPMRDTLESVYSVTYQPLRWEKRINEDGYRLTDEITYNYSPQSVVVHSRRFTSETIKIDTILNVPNKAPVVDMLSCFSLLRNLDTEKFKKAKKLPFLIPIGKDLVKAELVLSGEEQLKMPEGTEVTTIRIDLNIHDEAFQNANKAAEVWITKDEKQIPLKVRSKLKLGYAECTLTSMRYK